jgi:ABC-type branched-subunit amino acid transport system ATPase component
MILELKNISSGYLKRVDVIHNISLQLSEGSVTGILGLNGAGKSTLCGAIMNMNPYRSGELFFEGNNVSKLNTEQLSRLGISIFLSDSNTFPELTVWENLMIASHGLSSHEVDEIRSIFPVLSSSKSVLKRKLADKLSGGERNQLAVAMCLLSKAKLLILDEPSSGLSPTAIKTMYKILEQIRTQRGVTILLIEQAAELAQEFCDRVWVMENGKIMNVILTN